MDKKIIELATISEESPAFFLDVDGTLLEIANKPDEVHVSTDLINLLDDLKKSLGDALALISGRTIGNLDQLFQPLKIASAGKHGLEIRDIHGNIKQMNAEKPPKDIKDKIARFASQHPGILVEDKGVTMALHYRLVPFLEDKALRFLTSLLSNHENLKIIKGKMVLEVVSKIFDKGTAINFFMNQEPFRNKLPLFIGDDITDEDGFRIVNSRKGITIKVGENFGSLANFEVQDVPSVHALLEQYLKETTKKNWYKGFKRNEVFF